MLDIFEKLGDLIAPPHPAVAQIRMETPETFVRYLDPELVGDTVALAHLIVPKVHAAITANKFCDYEPAAKLLSALVQTWLATLPPLPTILVPIPLGPQRHKDRGYNQVTRILSCVTHDTTTVKPLLIRPHDTTPQTELGRTARLINLKSAFVVGDRLPADLAGTRVIICDDVVTTGATLEAARVALAPHLLPDTELVLVALAH